jgi:hypothetical protein
VKEAAQEAALAGALYDRKARVPGKQAVELPQHGYAEQAAANMQKGCLIEALGVQKKSKTKRTVKRPRPSSGFYGVCYNA